MLVQVKLKGYEKLAFSDHYFVLSRKQYKIPPLSLQWKMNMNLQIVPFLMILSWVTPNLYFKVKIFWTSNNTTQDKSIVNLSFLCNRTDILMAIFVVNCMTYSRNGGTWPWPRLFRSEFVICWSTQGAIHIPIWSSLSHSKKLEEVLQFKKGGHVTLINRILERWLPHC